MPLREKRANRLRLIAVGWRLMVVIGGAPPEAQAALLCRGGYSV